MMVRTTFGHWLRDTRTAHGYSQVQLAEAIGMHRTYVNNLERADKWPRPETRARFHAIFGTSDDDLVAAGVAVRKEYPRPGKPARVVYEAMVAGAASDVPAGMPAEVGELLRGVTWTPENIEALRSVVSLIRRSDARAATGPARPDRPAPPPRVSATPADSTEPA